MALTRIEDRIWLCDGGNVSFYGIAYPTRSVIAELDERQLWVWSPVALDDGLRGELDALGDVAHLVSPNKLHHLFLADWKRAFPEARLWGPQSLIRRRPDLAFEAPLGDNPPLEWNGAIDHAWFRGSFALDEIAFFHRPSRTAIVADLVQAFSAAYLEQNWAWWQRPLARLDGLSAKNPGAPREWRATFLDRRAARAARSKMLEWNAERVVIAHGEWCRRDGTAFLERAFAWLGPER